MRVSEGWTLDLRREGEGFGWHRTAKSLGHLGAVGCLGTWAWTPGFQARGLEGCIEAPALQNQTPVWLYSKGAGGQRGSANKRGQCKSRGMG